MERIYNVPLRKEFMKAPIYKRSEKAITALREFFKRHMKTEEVIIGKYLNQEIWKKGPRHPPHHVSVKAIKEENKVKIELVNAPEEKIEEKEKKTKKDKKTEKKEEIKVAKEEEEDKETKKEE